MITINLSANSKHIIEEYHNGEFYIEHIVNGNLKNAIKQLNTIIHTLPNDDIYYKFIVRGSNKHNAIAEYERKPTNNQTIPINNRLS